MPCSQIRVFNGFTLHYLPRRHLPVPVSTSSSPTIFRPTVYSTSVPLGEIDFSFHKSNSTYLTDLDVARGYHVYTVFRQSFFAWTTKYGAKKRVFPVLGGATCVWKKEIKPLEKVDVWTRVLGWDEKWFYMVSHFVRPSATNTGTAKGGKNQAEGITTGGSKEGANTSQWNGKNKVKDGQDSDKERIFNKEEGPQDEVKKEEEPINPNIYATCICKYVLKQGRKTVKPEEFFKLGGLMGNESLEGFKENWQEINKVIEEKRLEGMKLAAHVAALDEGHKLFMAEQDVLDVY